MFVKNDSVVKKIWGNADTILFIFGGAAAEFALNKAVDWLYFTGRLPADPIGRLFSTVTYARHIVFASNESANAAIDKMRMIHTGVENKRGYNIPDWAYRDVLFMLIHYSISSFELLERKLSEEEKEEVFDVFNRVGTRMGLKDLPTSYIEWLPVYKDHLEHDLQKSNYTIDLFKQYKKHLGPVRFKILQEAQILVVPRKVHELLELRNTSLLKPLIPIYKLSRKLKMDSLIKSILLPAKYKKQIMALNSAD
ncbi:MAG TPA: oxygenase MpaB family protein [Flavitalea sp.]|nr:oxygenase MpaB family protein [Flavitalea sp.]HTF31225.1 oxygenase MpaB family protein [Flavitalea sp.]